jgi:hypothetical protein
MKKLTLLVFIACACWGCNAVTKVAGTETQAKTSSIDPKADVMAASQKFNSLKSLSGKVESTGDTPFTKNVEFTAPNNYHVTYHDQAGGDMELITVGDQSYIKTGDSWTKLHGDEPPTPTMRLQFSDETMRSISDAKFEGEDIIDGKTALVYSYKRVAVVGNFHVTCKIWVAKDSGIPIKSYEEYAEGVVKTRTTNFDTQSPVTIELPAK